MKGELKTELVSKVVTFLDDLDSTLTNKNKRSIASGVFFTFRDRCNSEETEVKVESSTSDDVVVEKEVVKKNTQAKKKKVSSKKHK